MKVITYIKQYLRNWPEPKPRPSFWEEQLNLIKSIPRITILFILPFLIAALIIKLSEFLGFASIPYPTFWGLILGFIIMFLIGRWLES